MDELARRNRSYDKQQRAEETKKELIDEELMRLRNASILRRVKEEETEREKREKNRNRRA